MVGKKRRSEDQRQSDSEIRYKCLQNGSSSSRMGPEGIPRETSLERILQQMADGFSMNTEILRGMQVKDEKFRKMDEKYEKKFKKVKEKNKKKFKEMEEKLEKQRNDYEEKLEKQRNDYEVMKEKWEGLKDNAAVRSSCYSSPAQRTQPDKSQQARLNLKILSKVKRTVYKGKIIQTDTEDCVQVQLFDGATKISHDHPLSSASVQLVILKEEFNKCGQKYWSEDDFMEGQKRHGEGNTPMRIKNSTFDLTAGYASHAKAIILDNSNRKEVKLGVKLVGYHEERVLEGISNIFKVQEAKTEPKEETRVANGQQLQAPMNNSLQHTIARSANENGNIFDSNHQQQSYPQVTMNNWSLPTFSQSTEHGQGVRGYCQQSFQQNSMYTSHNAALTCNAATESVFRPTIFAGHGEYLHTPQDFDQQHNSYMQEIGGGNDLGMLPGFQTQSTTDGQYPERPVYAGDLHPQTQNQAMPNLQSGDGVSAIINQVQLQFDEPNVEPRQWRNILDKLMPLCPDKGLLHEYDRLFASDYFLKITMRDHGTVVIANRGMQQHHNRGVLIRSLEDNDSEHEPPIKTEQQASYQLRFVNKACREYYVWGQIKAEDGGLLKVALYNEDSLRITSGPLSSASVEIVLLHGDFNADGQDYWSADEFGNYILCPLSEEPPALGGDCVLTLVDGKASLSSASFLKTSSFARTGKFTMGVKMKTTVEERVQEGITQPFLVQVRQDEGSNTCRPSDLACGLIKLSEEVSTSLDRGSLMRRRGSSFLTAQDRFTRLHPGVSCTTLPRRKSSIPTGGGAMKLTVMTADEQILSLDVDPDESVENLKALLEVETRVPLQQQVLHFNGKEMNNAVKLSAIGVHDGDLVMMVAANNRTSEDLMRLNPDGSAANPQAFQQHIRGNSQLMAQLLQNDPSLAQAILGDDITELQNILRSHQQQRLQHKRKQEEELALLYADPFDVEAQKKIEAAIRQKGIDENWEAAIEHNPEAFGRVVMLYVDMEVNGVPLKAFVDSGAQSTIISKDCAERCGLLRLLDQRYRGVAIGVGQSEILGRIHVAPIKIGDIFYPCSFTVLDAQNMEFLFGLDMLRKHQCIIDLKDNVLRVGGGEVSVPFLHEKDIPSHERDDKKLLKQPSASQGAAGESSKAREKTPDVPPRSPPAGAPAVIPPQGGDFEAKVTKLVELGFDRASVIQALKLCNGNEDQAAGFLFGGF